MCLEPDAIGGASRTPGGFPNLPTSLFPFLLYSRYQSMSERSLPELPSGIRRKRNPPPKPNMRIGEEDILEESSLEELGGIDITNAPPEPGSTTRRYWEAKRDIARSAARFSEIPKEGAAERARLERAFQERMRKEQEEHDRRMEALRREFVEREIETEAEYIVPDEEIEIVSEGEVEDALLRDERGNIIGLKNEQFVTIPEAWKAAGAVLSRLQREYTGVLDDIKEAENRIAILRANKDEMLPDRESDLAILRARRDDIAKEMKAWSDFTDEIQAEQEKEEAEAVRSTYHAGMGEFGTNLIENPFYSEQAAAVAEHELIIEKELPELQREYFDLVARRDGIRSQLQRVEEAEKAIVKSASDAAAGAEQLHAVLLDVETQKQELEHKLRDALAMIRVKEQEMSIIRSKPAKTEQKADILLLKHEAGSLKRRLHDLEAERKYWQTFADTESRSARRAVADANISEKLQILTEQADGLLREKAKLNEEIGEVLTQIRDIESRAGEAEIAA